jgi:phage N-6-adenine-methyltransferase
MSFSTVSKSSKSTEYGTPKDFFDKLNKIFRFSLDPCTTKDNPLGTERFFTQKEDGLRQEWNGNTFINPPFGKGIDKWLYKMWYSNLSNNSDDCNYVMLLPARTDTRWFQDLIMKKYVESNSVIYFIKGRIKFVNPVLNGKKEPAIIGSMLWIMTNDDYDELNDLKKSIPGILIDDWIIK